MKEYGGYFDIDTYRLPMLHEGSLSLNCGRNCLAYLIESKQISKIKLPYYLCNSVIDICKKYGVRISFYHINERFQPLNITLESDEWLYVVNYFGQLTRDYIIELKNDYNRVIVDNAQAYFDDPIDNIDTYYTCRKFFGVADGAFLYTNSCISRSFPQDESYNRMRYLLGRFERTAAEFYNDSVANNLLFKDEPIKYMSKLTYNLLHGIDYEFVKQQRTNNYLCYYEKLKEKNKLELRRIFGGFAYPFLIENGDRVRKELQQMKIYVPILWPNVVEELSVDCFEYKLALNNLPLPCDQRYGAEDIEYIVNQLGGLL